MTVLLQHLWPALAATGVLGLAFALVLGPGSGLPSARLEVRIGAALALVGGVVVSALGWVPGRPGLWLDIAVACALAYALGVLVGTGLRWLWLSRRRPADAEDAPA